MRKDDDFALFYALSIALQLGFLIMASIGGFVLLGVYLDKIFETSYLFSIIGILIGIITTIYEVWHTLKPLIKDKDKK